jgi:hypothetical protein
LYLVVYLPLLGHQRAICMQLEQQPFVDDTIEQRGRDYMNGAAGGAIVVMLIVGLVQMVRGLFRRPTTKHNIVEKRDRSLGGRVV